MTCTSVKTSLKDVEKAILDSAKAPRYESVTRLRDEMNNLGYNFPQNRKGEKMAYKVAEELWWNIREQKQPLGEFPITKLDDLPSTRVRFGGKDYFLHGIVHWTDGKPLAKPVKDFIHEKTVKYATKDRSKIFLEPGLEEFLVGVYGQSSRLKMFNLCDSVALPLMMRIASLESKAKETVKTFEQVRNDINYLPKAKELLTRMQLPEPLYMDSIRDDDSKRKYATDYSERMMHNMLNNSVDIDEIHALIGMAHEPQIEYLLNHTDEETAKKIIMSNEFYNFVKKHQ